MSSVPLDKPNLQSNLAGGKLRNPAEGDDVSTLTDEELIRRAQAGEKERLGELYDRHQMGVFRYLMARVQDQQLAEDLTGDVFMRVLDHLSGYENRRVPFTSWLFRVTRNLLIDHYRKEGKYKLSPLDQNEGLKVDQPSVLSHVEEKITIEQVRLVLTRLDEDQSEVIVLRFLVGLSLKEVARSLEKSVPAVKALQHRGLKYLRTAFSEEKE
jgi:RNA polymerase sigma-70 factor (ECF subfamily)